MAIIGVLLAALTLGTAATGSGADASADVRFLVGELERLHPEPYHAIPRDEFRRRADELAARAPGLRRDQLVVETMRLFGSLGEREGHSGLFTTWTGHRVPLHAFPFRAWRFPEGYYVTRAADRSLVGARIVAIEDVPIVEVEARLRPLVTRDNESSLTFGLSYHLASAEVLRGLGITSSLERARFTVVASGGATREVVLDSLTVPEQQRALPSPGLIPAPQGMPRRKQPLYQRLIGLRYGITPLQKGRAVYVAYNQTTYPGLLPRRLLALARKRKVHRVVVDLRQNGGGDNTTYGSLLAALRSRVVNRPGRLVVLTSRVTFSAAGNFAADIDRSTRARFFGEPTGGSPNNYGEAQEVELPSLGLSVFVPTQWVVTDPGDQRVTIEPDVPVPTTAADYFAGRDPVLARALR
jgi:Peptidase family S41